MSLRKIIVGVDESDGAAGALRWARSEAALHGAEVEAVLAWTLLDQHRAITGEPFNPKYGDADAVEALRACVTHALGEEGLGGLRLSAACDLAAPALLEAAHDADLLVVGARGLGGFRGLLLGSVSQQCLHQATTPIAIIRPTGTPVTGRDRVVVGVDGSPTGQRALRWAASEAVVRNAELDVVTAWQLAFEGSMSPSCESPAHGAQAAADLLAAAVDAEDLEGARAVRTIALHGTPAGTIVDHAVGAGLLVVGSRGLGPFKRAMLGSVATQVSHHAPCPLVVIPASDDDVRA
jgi:nucleotide-binding universal stress UspA family protein